MPKVHFASDDITVEVKKGALLKDVAEEVGASLPFGCRLGSCGTCRCLIPEGMDNLNKLTELETEMFDSFTTVGANERLGCQLIIMGDVKVQN